MWEFSRYASSYKEMAALSSAPQLANGANSLGTIETASFGGSYPSRQITLEKSSDVPRSGIDTPLDAAFDSAENLWIVGSTTSDDFSLVNPIVAKKVPYRETGFVVELDSTGSTVKFASWLGGRQPKLLSS